MASDRGIGLALARQDLARRNPEIPGLGSVLDPDAFLAHLQQAVPRASLGAAHIHAVRLEPHACCRVSYRLDVAGEPHDVEARACTPAELESWIEEAGRESTSGPLGSECIVLRAPAIVVTTFPNDSKLRAVRDLTDERKRFRLLRELLPEREDLWSGELRCLRYRSQRRYVAELRAENGARALLKASTAKGHLRCKQNAMAFHSSGPLRVARLLGCSDERRLLAFEWLPGVQLFEHCVAPRMDPEAVVAAGVALAALHSQSPNGLECWTRESEAADLSSVADELGFLCPRLARRAGELSRRLADRLAGEPVVRTALHGDFSTRHVLVNGGGAGIVDLDWSCRGDPADDLGSILAQVERHALCGELARERAEPFQDALLSGYGLSRAGGLPKRIGLYTAIELFRGARFPFRRNEPDWPERTALLLERAWHVWSALNSHAAMVHRVSSCRA